MQRCSRMGSIWIARVVLILLFIVALLMYGISKA